MHKEVKPSKSCLMKILIAMLVFMSCCSLTLTPFVIMQNMGVIDSSEIVIDDVPAFIESVIELDILVDKPSRTSQLIIPSKPPVNHRETCKEFNMYDETPLTGFVDDWGFCVPGIVTNEVWFTRSPQYVYGSAVWYAPGLMRATAKWRDPDTYAMYHLAYRSDDYLGAVAVLSPANIGDTVWLRRDGGEWEGKYLVVDCSRRADMYSHIAINQQVVEVDFETALRWGLVSGNYDDWEMVSGKENVVELWYGEDKPTEWIDEIQPPIYFAKYWLDNVVEFQREEIELSPWFYPNGLNPTWDLRDGNGEQCLTSYCLSLTTP